MVRNAESLRWALYRSLDESLDRFTATLDQGLDRTARATRDGVVAGLERRAHAENQIQGEVEILSALEAGLATLQAAVTTSRG